MVNSNKIYPYPVLGNNDDIEGLVRYAVNPEIDQDEITIKVTFDLKHPTLEKLINLGEAVFSVDVICKKTLVKTNTRSSEAIFQIRVKADEVRERVDVAGYIIAASNIETYDPEGVHRDMDFGPVSVEAGDILADAGKTWFLADKFFDPLRTPVSSFIKIIKGGNMDGAYVAEFDKNVIMIRIPDTQFADYSYAKGSNNGALIHAPIVLPVLVEAISIVNSPASEDLTQTWVSKLAMIIDQKGLDPSDPYVTAQELLGLPVKRYINALKEIVNR